MRACQIMTSEVITVGADANVVEAIKMMIDNQVSGLPVVDPAGHLIGIISQGDFIRRAEIGTQRKRARWLTFLTGPRQAALDFSREHGRKVADIMTANPVTITEDAPLEQIVQIMESRNVKRVPVMRGDRLVGMVTRADFLPALVELARDVPGVPEGDEHIRKAVIAAIATTAWRPCKLKVRVRDGIREPERASSRGRRRDGPQSSPQKTFEALNELKMICARRVRIRRRNKTLAAAILCPCRNSPQQWMTNRSDGAGYE